METPRPTLSPQEFAIVEKYVAGLERAAGNWRRHRWAHLVVVLFCGLVGCRYIFEFWSDVVKPYDVSARVAEIEIPDGAPPDLWFVAELRRTVALLQTSNQYSMLGALEGAIGLLCLTMAGVQLTRLTMRWNDGPRKVLLARLARWQLSQWT